MKYQLARYYVRNSVYFINKQTIFIGGSIYFFCVYFRAKMVHWKLLNEYFAHYFLLFCLKKISISHFTFNIKKFQLQIEKLWLIKWWKYVLMCNPIENWIKQVQRRNPYLCLLQKSISFEKRDFFVLCLQFHCFFLPHINGGYKSFWFLSFIWSLLREIKTMVSQRHLIISFEQRKIDVFLSLSRKSYFHWKTMTAYHGLYPSILQHRALNAD